MGQDVVVSNTAKFELGLQSRPQSGKLQKDSFMSDSQKIDPLIEEVEIE